MHHSVAWKQNAETLESWAIFIFAFKILSTRRGGKWYLENVGLRKFWQDLEISGAYLLSLEVSKSRQYPKSNKEE